MLPCCCLRLPPSADWCCTHAPWPMAHAPSPMAHAPCSLLAAHLGVLVARAGAKLDGGAVALGGPGLQTSGARAARRARGEGSERLATITYVQAMQRNMWSKALEQPRGQGTREPCHLQVLYGAGTVPSNGAAPGPPPLAHRSCRVPDLHPDGGGHVVGSCSGLRQSRAGRVQILVRWLPCQLPISIN